MMMWLRHGCLCQNGRGGLQIKRYKRITAGRLVRCAVYSVPDRQDAPPVRAARQKVSSAAQARLNVKTSRDKLEMLLACNFDAGDLWVTLTYDDECLPSDRQGARVVLQRFFRTLRAVRKKRGHPLRYIYCTQTVLDDGTSRLHHHMMVNATGPEDFDDIRSLWTAGSNIKIKHLDGDGDITDKATYMCHEPIEHGKPKVGEQMWTPSRGLARPVEEIMDVPDDVTLAVPAGAELVENDAIQNEYGDYAFVKYWMPRIPKMPGGILSSGEVLTNGRRQHNL